MEWGAEGVRDGLGGGAEACLGSRGVPLTFAKCFFDELGKRKTDFQEECDDNKGDEGECMIQI